MWMRSSSTQTCDQTQKEVQLNLSDKLAFSNRCKRIRATACFPYLVVHRSSNIRGIFTHGDIGHVPTIA
jgi:hypothetical protein